MTVIKRYNPATETWDSLVMGGLGPTGPTGATGPTGPTGATGPSGQWDTAQGITAYTGSTNYTALNSDAGKVITVNTSSSINVTINTSLALTAGQRIEIVRLGTGEITISASSTTINATPGFRLRAQYSSATLLCLSSNNYVLIGDLKV
jgi:hypothetical protein